MIAWMGMDGPRALRATLRSVHPPSLPPRLSPDSTRTTTRRTCRRPHPISPPTARPRRFGRCDLHLAHSLQPLVAGPQGQSVPICAPRVPVSLPARAPVSCLSASTYLPVPCGLTRHRRRQNAPELADDRDASPLPFPPSPVALLLVGWPGSAARRRWCRRRLCYDRPAAANGTHQYCYVRNLLRLRRCSVLSGATHGSGVRRARKVAWAAARSRRQAGTARLAERGGVALLLGRPPPRVRASGADSVRASERAE
jgi:hypothetical protein